MELSVKLDQSERAAVARAEAAEQAVEQAAREARLASLAQRERQEKALVELHAAQARATAAEVKKAEGKRERHFTKHSPSVLFWDISFLIFSSRQNIVLSLTERVPPFPHTQPFLSIRMIRLLIHLIVPCLFSFISFLLHTLSCLLILG